MTLLLNGENYWSWTASVTIGTMLKPSTWENKLQILRMENERQFGTVIDSKFIWTFYSNIFMYSEALFDLWNSLKEMHGTIIHISLRWNKNYQKLNSINGPIEMQMGWTHILSTINNWPPN